MNRLLLEHNRYVLAKQIKKLCSNYFQGNTRVNRVSIIFNNYHNYDKPFVRKVCYCRVVSKKNIMLSLFRSLFSSFDFLTCDEFSNN